MSDDTVQKITLTGQLPDQQSLYPLPSEIITVHREGVFITTLQDGHDVVNLCYWNECFVGIYCRRVHHDWEPYQLLYYRNEPVYIGLISQRLTVDQAEALNQRIHSID